MTHSCNKNCTTLRCGMAHYLTKLGPVIFGDKPLHLFSFKEEPTEFIDALMQCQRINYKIINSKKSYKIMIYNPHNCKNILKDKRCIKFLKSQGFEFTWVEYLDYFENSLALNEMPHILGIFFGYPVKDVIGFMGEKRLKKTKVQGWCVFGDPRLSDVIFGSFKQAENKMKQLLSESTINELFGLI